MRKKPSPETWVQTHLHQQDTTDSGGTICKIEQVRILGIDQTRGLYYQTKNLEKTYQLSAKASQSNPIV